MIVLEFVGLIYLHIQGEQYTLHKLGNGGGDRAPIRAAVCLCLTAHFCFCVVSFVSVDFHFRLG